MDLGATFRVLEQLLSNFLTKLEQIFEKIGATCGQPYGGALSCAAVKGMVFEQFTLG